MNSNISLYQTLCILFLTVRQIIFYYSTIFIFGKIMEHNQDASFIQQDPNQQFHPVQVIDNTAQLTSKKKKKLFLALLVLLCMTLMFAVILRYLFIKKMQQQPYQSILSSKNNQTNNNSSQELAEIKSFNISHSQDINDLEEKVNNHQQQTTQSKNGNISIESKDIVKHNTNLLIISFGSNMIGIPGNLQNFQLQTFQNWQAVYYRYSTENNSFNNSQKVRLMKSSGNKGRDIYQAIITFSKQDSIVLLLDENQILASIDQFQKIVKHFQDQSIYAGFLGYNLDAKVKIAPNALLKFRRDGLVQTKKNSAVFSVINQIKQSMVLILNHMRVFRSKNYKQILYFDLMNDSQIFYDCEISFLLPLFEMKNSSMHVKNFQQTIFTTQKQKVLGTENFTKQIAFHTIYHPLQKSRQLKLLPTITTNALNRKQIIKKEVVPKKIHQIAFSDLKEFQQIVIKKTNQVYTKYQTILWKRQNITTQNFPITSPYVLSVLKNNTKLTQKQQRQLKTIMMWQLLYIHGGIYIDIAYESFKQIPDILNYNLTIFMDSGLSSDHVPNKIMAAKSHNQFLLKLLTNQFFKTFQNGLIDVFSVQYLLSKMTIQDFFINLKIFSAWRLSTRIVDVIDARRSHSDCYLITDCDKLNWNFGFQHWRIRQQAAVFKKQNVLTANTLSNQKVQLCFLSIISSRIQHFIQSNSMIEKQIFSNWKAHYYVREEKDKIIRQQLIGQKFKNKIAIHISSGNSGRDTYDGMINKCGYDSIAVLLDEGEKLYDEKTAQIYAQKLKNPNIYLIGSSFMQKNKTLNFNSKIFQFRRDSYFSRNVQVKDLPINMMQTIRIIRCQMYRRLGYFDLMYQNQTFYKQKVSYLYPLIQFRCKRQCKFNHGQQRFKVPGKIQQVNAHPLYITDQIESINNQQQFLELNKKMIHPPTIDIINFAFSKHPHGNPLTNDPLLWDNKLNVLQRNISDSQKIPKIVHQIWVGQQIPTFKVKLMNRTKTVLGADGYEYKLWRNENITKQNFPLSYYYIQKLIEIDKTSQFTRYSMVADLIKTEALYHYGGFYIDTNIQVFRTFTPLLKYPFVATLDMAGFQGQYISSLMGAQKNSKFLRRLFQPQILQTLNLYEGPKSNLETGPAFFARAFYPEDYFFSIKVLPPQRAFPYVKYAYDKRFRINKCSYSSARNAFINLQKQQDQIITVQKFKLLHPCRMYPDAYTNDYFELGASWKKARF